jgi:hypothetical protein
MQSTAGCAGSTPLRRQAERCDRRARMVHRDELLRLPTAGAGGDEGGYAIARMVAVQPLPLFVARGARHGR